LCSAAKALIASRKEIILGTVLSPIANRHRTTIDGEGRIRSRGYRNPSCEVGNMNGFDGLKTSGRHESALTDTKIPDATRHDIQRSVARAHRLRAAQLGKWGHNVVQTWASLFRRPGRLLPTRSGSRDRLVNAAQL
jgi:hypothetical protein